MNVHASLRLIALGLVLAASPVSAAAQSAPQSDEIERVTESVEVLESLVRAPDDAIPQYILDRAEAVVVIPTLVKGGFVVGAEHGRGIMSVRDRATGTWSAPAFVALTGGSFGWQIGVQSVDMVLLVMNRDGINDLLKSEFKLGANASVAAGPVGRTAQAATDARMGAQILAYSRAKGLFAGATIEGASLREDTNANRKFYGRAIEPEAILKLPADPSLPAAVEMWKSGVAKLMPAKHH
jgi:lipid-binding SYLF domain-containing protein